MDNEHDPLIRKLLRRPSPPSVFQTEAFVTRVMSRLPEEAPGWLVWLTGRRLAPALALGLAAAAFSLFQPVSRDLSPAAELIASGPDRSVLASWEAGPASASAADLVGLDSEDQ